MNGTPRRLRLGTVPYLNAKPLLWGLRREFEVIEALPVLLDEMLKRREVDGALVPVFALFDGQPWEVVDGVAIGCDGPVESVLLSCRGPIEQLKRVSLDPASRSSNALCQILLQQARGLSEVAYDLPSRQVAQLEPGEGLVVIGDAALSVTGVIGAGAHGPLPDMRNGLEVHDLGQMWREWTGLPFVFAVWGFPPSGLEVSDANRLRCAGAAGEESIPQIIADGGFASDDTDGLLRYLGKSLCFKMGEPQHTAIQRFSEECRALGLCPSAFSGVYR